MGKVTLSSGGWVELSEVAVTERQRRKAMIILQRVSPEARAALDPDNAVEFSAVASADDMAAMYDLNDAIACEMIVAWSFDAPMPVTPDSLGDLAGSDYNAILEAVTPALDAFMGVTNFRTSPEPASPT